MGRTILLICYWGLNEELTTATVLPRLEVLEQMQSIESVVLITIERESISKRLTLPEHLTKLKHIALYSGRSFFSKIKEPVLFQRKLLKLIEQERIDLIIGHSAMAGTIANRLSQKTDLPYLVSSFEPHADYMLESKVWNRHGLKYKFQKYWESLQKKNAFGLMPVSEGYKSKLIQEGVEGAGIFVVPCSVEVAVFKYSVSERDTVRKQLNWQQATIGIYVGKYGGLYYEEEAFAIYKRCFESIPDFRLIILTPQAEEAKRMFLQYHFDSNKVYITAVPHAQVPAYLSASDFALATYKPGPSKKYLSPVKIGEYWASGLPVLLTEGVGDDSDIIKKEGGGATFNLNRENSLEQAIYKIQAILQNPAHRQEIPKLAAKYRSPENIKEAYTYFFNKLDTR